MAAYDADAQLPRLRETLGHRNARRGALLRTMLAREGGMMAFQQKPGQGALFRNRDRGDNERAPNLKGTALVLVGDQILELEIAAWTRESEKAGKWLSLSVKAKSIRPNEDVEKAFGR